MRWTGGAGRIQGTVEEALSRRNGSGWRMVSMIGAMDILSGPMGRVWMILPCSDVVVGLPESVYGLLSCVGMDIKKKRRPAVDAGGPESVRVPGTPC